MASVCLVGLWSLSPLAHAYEYNKNQKNGQPLRWSKGQQIQWYLNLGAFTKIPKTVIETTFKKAFDDWKKINCADLTFVYRGVANIAPSNKDKKNVIAFLPTSGGTIMSTSYGLDANGNLSDIDVRLSPTVDWSVTPNGGQQDLEGAAMYVVGLLIGLSSSKVMDATMFGTFQAGDISKRTLDTDDLNGACFLYPNNKAQCAADTDCPPGLSCKSAKCALTAPTKQPNMCKLCQKDADCGAGYTCDFFGGDSVCIQKCSPDNLCPTGHTCNGTGFAALCYPDPGICPAQTCTSDADCATGGGGHKCITGKCVLPNCTPNKVQGCFCGNKKGTQKCSADGATWGNCDCSGSGTVCTGGASQACKCSDGKDGTQTCASDGSKWEDCKCGGTTTTCTAGASQACTCTDGKSGTQACASDGSKWETCTCGGTGGVCTPGGTQTCVCTDGKNGSQSCASDGKSWGQCTCGGGTGNVCAPGSTQACICTNGSSGAQSCNTDGKAWGQCSCQGTPTTCTNGQQQACTCAGGGSGTQFCNSGAWAACNCQGTTNPQTCPAEGATKPCTCADGAASTQLCTGGQWAACNCQTGGGPGEGCGCSTQTHETSGVPPFFFWCVLLLWFSLRLRRK